jgi:hypothetical protein
MAKTTTKTQAETDAEAHEERAEALGLNDPGVATIGALIQFARIGRIDDDHYDALKAHYADLTGEGDDEDDEDDDKSDDKSKTDDTPGKTDATKAPGARKAASR